jgi:O-antigen/teichoic acid export membrane protein
MLTSLTRFIKNVMKAKVESIFVIASVFLVLFTAIMDPYISFAIAAVLLVASAIYKFVERQKRERGYLNG